MREAGVELGTVAADEMHGRRHARQLAQHGERAAGDQRRGSVG
jgi:hypothetical protein